MPGWAAFKTSFQNPTGYPTNSGAGSLLHDPTPSHTSLTVQLETKTSKLSMTISMTIQLWQSPWLSPWLSATSNSSNFVDLMIRGRSWSNSSEWSHRGGNPWNCRPGDRYSDWVIHIVISHPFWGHSQSMISGIHIFIVILSSYWYHNFWGHSQFITKHQPAS